MKNFLEFFAIFIYLKKIVNFSQTNAFGSANKIHYANWQIRILKSKTKKMWKIKKKKKYKQFVEIKRSFLTLCL